MIKSAKWLAAAALAVCSVVAHAAPVSGQGTWETTLQPRDINGDSVVDAWYDTALNLTWLADWNANVSPMGWNDAMAWAAGLNVYGVTGWRLPGITDIGNDGCNWSYAGTDCGFNVDTSGSELAHMWYVTLGNLAWCDTLGSCPQTGWGLTNTGPFSNMYSVGYWSNMEYVLPSYAWYFSSDVGRQFVIEKWMWWWRAVAVRPGDVAAVPEAGSLALLLAGLGALAVARRRRH